MKSKFIKRMQAQNPKRNADNKTMEDIFQQIFTSSWSTFFYQSMTSFKRNGTTITPPIWNFLNSNQTRPNLN